MKKIVLALFATFISVSSANAADDMVKAGKKVTKKCKICHEFKEAKGNKIGPNLFGIVGRKAASVKGFKYSDAMVAKGADGVVWDEATLDAYVKKPSAWLPKGSMLFKGLDSKEDREALIAYLKTLK